MIRLSEHFNEAIARFDAANAADPNKEVFEGKEYPKELLYANRMTAWLDKFEPEATEALRLATRAQHICRWKIPRSEYPLGRDGYNKWRTTLANMHGEIAAEIMQQVGYDEQMCEQVKALLMKDRIKLAGDDGQTLEDVVCLVFLEFYFAPFAPQYSAPKLTSIVRKTWRKMSERGHKTALTLAPGWPADLLEIVKKAIA
ncbi:MAG: DUF4202 domain-containing protein [Gallionella sp.]